MKRKLLIILTLGMVLILAGCVTNGISLRAVRDPNTTLEKNSRLYLDAFSDVSIEYRSAFSAAEGIARHLGIQLVEREKSEFVMRLNYRRGLRYNSARKEFELDLYIRGNRSDTWIGNSSVDYGIINAGVFSTSAGSPRTAWEASVEVNDMDDPAEVEVSLRRLFEKFAEDFVGEVPGAPRNSGRTSNK